MYLSGYLTIKNLRSKVLLVILVATMCVPAYSQAPAAEPIVVRAGESIEMQLAGGQRKLLRIDCASGQFNSLSIEQRGIDVAARLLDQQGNVVVEYDRDPRLNGEEPVEFMGGADGVCQFAIEPRQRDAPQGKVLVRAGVPTPATDKDRILDEARRGIADATKLWRASKYQEALPLAERALALRSRELGPEHPDTGMAIFTVANVYSDLPDFKKAEANYQKALEIRSKALGPDHFSLASIYNNFGVLYKDMGLYTKAEEMYQKSLNIRERVLEPGHLLIASTTNNVAAVARLRGDEEKARALYEQVLRIREKALGPDHPDVATALNNLANPRADLAIVEPLYLRSLAIREKTLPPDHPDLAQTWFNLSVSYSLAGEHDKAQAAADRSLAVFQKSFGPEHPITLFALNQSAVIAASKGDFTKALELFKRTIAIREKVLGMFHPELANSLAGLAYLYAITGDIQQAIAAQARANEIVEYNTSLNLIAGSEREKLRYMQMLSDFSDRTLTLNFGDAKVSKAATELAMSSVLQRKGRVLDVMSEGITTLRRRLEPNDLKLLDEMTEINSRLSTMILSGPSKAGIDDHQKQISKLEADRDSLEGRLSIQAFAQFNGRKRSVVSQVRESLPADTALVEFATYRPNNPKNKSHSALSEMVGERGPERYVVFVVQKSGDIKSADLGDAKAIDLVVSRFRNALRDPQGNGWKSIAKDLSDKLMKPVLTLVGGTDRLLLSPDGQLNLMPFEALVANDGKLLIENHSIVYLTSGRDLIRLGSSAKRTANPVIVASPDFGTGASSGTGDGSNASRRRSVTSADSLRDTYFGPLNGTAQEARAIQGLFPESVAFTGAKATETAVKQVAGPRILHLATHGFFVNSSGNATDLESDRFSLRYPLLRSGLAFAGANLRKGDKDDGILTALEASGLDLWGTELVVLSACDTGLGEIRNGEGVYGLRRSFLLAGAESVVMSLWPVSDQVTREMMTGYYQNLKKGLGRGEALRQVRLEMIKRPNRRHPFYWASFIQSGEWANLEGKR